MMKALRASIARLSSLPATAGLAEAMTLPLLSVIFSIRYGCTR